jgi:hypothetical protein
MSEEQDMSAVGGEGQEAETGSGVPSVQPGTQRIDEREAGLDVPSTRSDTQRIDELIERLERAGEQLRSGELSVDAAATLVEDCAALATQASAEIERLTRSEAVGQMPGQESLL